MPHITVAFTSEELGLLRAGLAAHSIAMKQYTAKNGSTDDEIASARQQSEACRELSIALGEAQIALATRKLTTEELRLIGPA